MGTRKFEIPGRTQPSREAIHRKEEDAIFVTVNPATGNAEAMIKFGEGLPADRPVAFGTFGEKDLAAIRKLEATAEVWKKWFT